MSEPKRPRGKCPECGYSFPLRKDGSVQTHKLYSGRDFAKYCPSGRRPPDAHTDLARGLNGS